LPRSPALMHRAVRRVSAPGRKSLGGSGFPWLTIWPAGARCGRNVIGARAAIAQDTAPPRGRAGTHRTLLLTVRNETLEHLPWRALRAIRPKCAAAGCGWTPASGRNRPIQARRRAAVAPPLGVHMANVDRSKATPCSASTRPCRTRVSANAENSDRVATRRPGRHVEPRLTAGS